MEWSSFKLASSQSLGTHPRVWTREKHNKTFLRCSWSRSKWTWYATQTVFCRSIQMVEVNAWKKNRCNSLCSQNYDTTAAISSYYTCKDFWRKYQIFQLAISAKMLHMWKQARRSRSTWNLIWFLEANYQVRTALTVKRKIINVLVYAVHGSTLVNARTFLFFSVILWSKVISGHHGSNYYH